MSASNGRQTLSYNTLGLINLLLVSIILISIAVLYMDGLSNIVSRWSSQAEYSHGFFIPLVSLYILWERRCILSLQVDRFNYLGFLIITLAFAMFLAGEISALYLLIHYSFLFFLVGFSLVILGKKAKYTWVPIALLAFAIPLPYFIEAMLTAKMQLLSSSIGVNIIRLFGIPVYLSGNVIDLGSFQLHVVEACSGLRYLFPLTCIGFVAAYFYNASWWKRALIFLTTIPITILLNSARIGFTGVLVEHFGSESAQGFLHDFEGWVVFLLCMLCLVLEIILLEYLTNRRSLQEAFSPIEVTFPEEVSTKQSHGINKRIGCLAVLATVSLFSVTAFDRREAVNINAASLATFPMRFQAWRGVRASVDQDIVDELQATDYLFADYRSERVSDIYVNLYIAYYNNQRKGISPHSPTVCIPGGGWEIAEFSRIRIDGMPVNRALIRKGNQSQLVHYWFVERGEVVANEYLKKWMLLRDAVSLNRSDGSLVRVVVPVENDTQLKKAEKASHMFIRDINPKIMSYLPGKSLARNIEL